MSLASRSVVPRPLSSVLRVSCWGGGGWGLQGDTEQDVVRNSTFRHSEPSWVLFWISDLNLINCIIIIRAWRLSLILYLWARGLASRGVFVYGMLLPATLDTYVMRQQRNKKRTWTLEPELLGSNLGSVFYCVALGTLWIFSVSFISSIKWE